MNICLKMAQIFGSLHGVAQQQRGRPADTAGHGRANGDGRGLGRHVAAQRAVWQCGRARVEHDLPRALKSVVMSPGAPAAASRMSASRQRAARSGVFRWQSVTVASARVSTRGYFAAELIFSETSYLRKPQWSELPMNPIPVFPATLLLSRSIRRRRHSALIYAGANDGMMHAFDGNVSAEPLPAP